MNEVDTIPTGTQEIGVWFEKLERTMNGVLAVMKLALNPAIVGIAINTVLIQVVEALDHMLPSFLRKPGTQEVPYPIVFAIAWVLTIPLMWVACLGLKLSFAGDNFGYALLSGPAAYIFSEFVLKKLGINLNKKWGKPPEPPAQP